MASEIAEKLSRRAVLKKAATLFGVAGSAALAASCVPPPAPPPPPPLAQPAPPYPPPPGVIRQTKAQAAYQDFPHGRQRCGVCVHFRAPNGCEIVEGPVQANGWCRNFRPLYPGGEMG